MASVAEIKAALLADQEAARQAFDLAVSSISTVSSVASWTITALGVVAALVAIFGWVAIDKGAKRVVNQVASHYLSSDKFSKMLEQKVAEAVAQRERSMVAIEDDTTDDDDPFPAPKEDRP